MPRYNDNIQRYSIDDIPSNWKRLKRPTYDFGLNFIEQEIRMKIANLWYRNKIIFDTSAEFYHILLLPNSVPNSLCGRASKKAFILKGIKLIVVCISEGYKAYLGCQRGYLCRCLNRFISYREAKKKASLLSKGDICKIDYVWHPLMWSSFMLAFKNKNMMCMLHVNAKGFVERKVVGGV